MTHFTCLSGVQIPKMIYGTAWKKQRTADLVETALEQGFLGIDTACQPKHYHESGVGEGLQRALSKGIQRNSLFIQTKYTPFKGQDPNNCLYNPNSSLTDQVLKSCEVSLRNLGISEIDSLVLHSPLWSFEQTMEVWTAMEALVEAGKVRQLGISNCYDQQLFERIFKAASIRPAVLQNRFYIESGYDVSLRKFCRQENIIYQSFWTLTANPRLLRSRPIVDCARKLNQTPAQILYRYLTQRQVVPLNGTTSVRHMQEDVAIFGFELSESACQRIDELIEHSQ